MTQAVRDLREEHRWIRLLLECLDRMIEAYGSGDEFDSEAAAEMQLLFERFVDEQHQAKEEVALVPRLIERVKNLGEDHAREREHLDRMRFSLFDARLGDPSGRARFIAEARAYVELQRQHMAFENLTVLPLAEQLLTGEDEQAVLAEFRRCEAESMPRDEIRERVHGLCERLGIE
jgi:hemerythrin-like domain-containing protein